MFVDQIIKRYEGTRLGAQELDAKILEDAEGALWTRDTLGKYRVTKAPELTKIFVAVDPKAESSADSAAKKGGKLGPRARLAETLKKMK